MAITRAQIAKQLLAQGGRIGLANGAQFDTSKGGGPISPGTSTSGGGRDVGGSTFGQFERRQEQNQALQGKGFLGKDLGMNIGEQSGLAKFGDFIKGGGITGAIIRGLGDIFTGTPITTTSNIDRNGGDGIPLWAQLGFNSEEEYLASLRAQAQVPSITEEKTLTPVQQALLERGDAVRFAAEGGIMDLDTGRQMYGLGKLVKKVTRGIKKIAKSPLGKAALIGGGLGLAGIGPFAGLRQTAFGTGLANFFGTGSFNPLKEAIPKVGKIASPFAQKLSKFGLADVVTGDLTGKGVGAAITAVSLLPLLGIGTGDESEEEAEELLRGQGIDIAAIRANPNQYLAPRFAAEGGIMRQQYQEGSKEPVAKKTMPLLDMGGMEKDYREEGGFVPIGRMEKADDVPARLSKNEFVFTADAVRNAGDGDIDKGAEVMYNMMKNLEAGGEVSEESQGLEGAREMFQTSRRLEEVL